MNSIATHESVGAVATKPVEAADIVILGAGYGGLHVAQRLARLLKGQRTADGAPWTTLIIDRQLHHQLTTELPWLVNNEVADDSLDIPLGQLLDGQRTRLLQAEIQSIRLGADAQPGVIETSVGAIAYSQLVIALGSISNDFGIPGVREHMRPFLTTEDARDLRLDVIRAIEEAARSVQQQPSTDLEELGQRMRVLIAGAGATGVEVAGALAELMAEEWETAWRIAGKPDHYRLPKPQIVLLDASPMVLAGWSRQTSQSVADALREMDVDLRLNTQIVQIESGCVQTKSGEWLAAGTLVWAGGVRAPSVLAAARAQEIDTLRRTLAERLRVLIGQTIRPESVYVDPDARMATVRVGDVLFHGRREDVRLVRPCAHCASGRFESPPLYAPADVGYALSPWLPAHPACAAEDSPYWLDAEL